MRRCKQMWLGQGKADATWVFMGWEGIQARLAGIHLHVFRLREHGIPYSYPLLLVITEETQRYRDVSRPVALFSSSACLYLGMLLKISCCCCWPATRQYGAIPRHVPVSTPDAFVALCNLAQLSAAARMIYIRTSMRVVHQQTVPPDVRALCQSLSLANGRQAPGRGGARVSSRECSRFCVGNRAPRPCCQAAGAACGPRWPRARRPAHGAGEPARDGAGVHPLLGRSQELRVTNTSRPLGCWSLSTCCQVACAARRLGPALWSGHGEQEPG